MPLVSQNDFSGGIAGKLAQHKVTDLSYIEDSENFVPNRDGSIRSRASATQLDIRTNPYDRVLKFTFKGEEFTLVYDPICKRRFRKVDFPESGVDLTWAAGFLSYIEPTDVTEMNATTTQYPYKNMTSDLFKSRFLEPLFETRVYNEGDPTNPDQAWLDNEVAWFNTVIKSGVWSDLTTRELFVQEKGYRERSTGSGRWTSLQGNSSDYKSKATDFLSCLAVDPYFDTYAYTRFKLYDSDYNVVCDTVVRPRFMETDTRESRVIDAAYEENLIGPGPIYENLKNVLDRKDLYGSSYSDYTVIVNPDAIMLYDVKGVLPPIILVETNDIRTEDTVLPVTRRFAAWDMRAYYLGNSFGTVRCVHCYEKNEAEDFIKKVRLTIANKSYSSPTVSYDSKTKTIKTDAPFESTGKYLVYYDIGTDPENNGSSNNNSIDVHVGNYGPRIQYSSNIYKTTSDFGVEVRQKDTGGGDLEDYNVYYLDIPLGDYYNNIVDQTVTVFGTIEMYSTEIRPPTYIIFPGDFHNTVPNSDKRVRFEFDNLVNDVDNGWRNSFFILSLFVNVDLGNFNRNQTRINIIVNNSLYNEVTAKPTSKTFLAIPDQVVANGGALNYTIPESVVYKSRGSNNSPVTRKVPPIGDLTITNVIEGDSTKSSYDSVIAKFNSEIEDLYGGVSKPQKTPGKNSRQSIPIKFGFTLKPPSNPINSPYFLPDKNRYSKGYSDSSKSGMTIKLMFPPFTDKVWDDDFIYKLIAEGGVGTIPFKVRWNDLKIYSFNVGPSRNGILNFPRGNADSNMLVGDFPQKPTKAVDYYRNATEDSSDSRGTVGFQGYSYVTSPYGLLRINFKDSGDSSTITNMFNDHTNLEVIGLPDSGNFKEFESFGLEKYFHKAFAFGQARLVTGFSEDSPTIFLGTPAHSLDFSQITNRRNELNDFAIGATGGLLFDIQTLTGFNGRWILFDSNEFLIGSDNRLLKLTNAGGGVPEQVGNYIAKGEQYKEILDNRYIVAGDTVYYQRYSRDYNARKFIDVTSQLKLIEEDFKISKVVFDESGYIYLSSNKRLYVSVVDERKDTLGWFPLKFDKDADSSPWQWGVSKGELVARGLNEKLVSWKIDDVVSNNEEDTQGTRNMAWLRFLDPDNLERLAQEQVDVDKLVTFARPVLYCSDLDPKGMGSKGELLGSLKDVTRNDGGFNLQPVQDETDSPEGYQWGTVTGVYFKPNKTVYSLRGNLV